MGTALQLFGLVALVAFAGGVVVDHYRKDRR